MSPLQPENRSNLQILNAQLEEILDELGGQIERNRQRRRADHERHFDWQTSFKKRRSRICDALAEIERRLQRLAPGARSFPRLSVLAFPRD